MPSKKFLIATCWFYLTLAHTSFDLHPLYAETQELRTANQEPQGTGMRLVSFHPEMILLPFDLQYPESWYVREEYGGIAGLFISREPIRATSDQYKVGMTVYYYPFYFVRPAGASSPLAQSSESVIEVRTWESTKQKFGKRSLGEANRLLSESDVIFAGQPAQRTEWQSEAVRVISYCVKAGNHLLLLTFEAPTGEFEKYRPTFEQIAASFQFTR